MSLASVVVCGAGSVVSVTMGGSGTATNVDGWNFTVSMDEDFGDAPGSYDSTAAASHIGYVRQNLARMLRSDACSALSSPVASWYWTSTLLISRMLHRS